MRLSRKRPLLVALLAAGLTGTTVPGLAQAQPSEPNTAAPKSEPATPKKKSNSGPEVTAHGMPFRGKLEAVDNVEKTLTVKGTEKGWTLQITSHTKLSKEGKPATLADAVVGENVVGFAKESAPGKFEAISIRFGAKPPGQLKPKKSKDEPKPEQQPQ